MTNRLTDRDLAAAIAFAREGLVERTLLAMRPHLGASMSDVLLYAMEELRTSRAILAVVAAMDELDMLGRMKVFREDAPALFTDEDGGALYLGEAVRRVIGGVK